MHCGARAAAETGGAAQAVHDYERPGRVVGALTGVGHKNGTGTFTSGDDYIAHRGQRAHNLACLGPLELRTAAMPATCSIVASSAWLSSKSCRSGRDLTTQRCLQQHESSRSGSRANVMLSGPDLTCARRPAAVPSRPGVSRCPHPDSIDFIVHLRVFRDFVVNALRAPSSTPSLTVAVRS